MRTFVLATFLVVVAAVPARAEGERGAFGVGIIAGRPTGVTGLYRMSDRTAIDVDVGLDVFDDNDLYIGADFLFILPDLLGGGSVGLSPYLGPGAFFVAVGDGVFGLRVPFGLSLDFTKAPLQIFLELAPTLVLVPNADLDIGGAIGFRYYF
jgi:hypothetical protein